MSFYDTARWKRLRKAQLQEAPFCAYCLQLGVRTPATVCDHITPHRGDPALFFNDRNLQSLCKTCHDGAKQRLERSGSLKGGDTSGMPLDPGHHWNC